MRYNLSLCKCNAGDLCSHSQFVTWQIVLAKGKVNFDNLIYLGNFDLRMTFRLYFNNG